MNPIKIFGVFYFCFLFGHAGLTQIPQEKNIRLEKGVALFNRALQKVFIHPDQLDEENKNMCRAYIKDLQEKFEEDFVDVQFERAFLSSPVTNYFRPLFIYPDGSTYALPGFKIMQ